MYNSMIRIEKRTGRGCNTLRLHQKEISVEKELLEGQDNEEPLSTRGK